jgi:hypothetical protein
VGELRKWLAELKLHFSEIGFKPEPKAALSASVKTLTGELEARTKERDEARAAFARTKFLLPALQRSYGLAATSTVQRGPRMIPWTPDGVRRPRWRSRHRLL